LTCTGEHVDPVFLPVQVRRTARLFTAAGVHLPPRQASITHPSIYRLL